MRNVSRWPLALFVLAGCGVTPATPQTDPTVRGRLDADPLDSGGPLLPEQAAYDVLGYDLSVEVFPDEKRISGRSLVRARVLAPLRWFVLDLDPLLEVHLVEIQPGIQPPRATTFQRHGGRLWVRLPRAARPGDQVAVSVEYAGTPREARNPPWSGGFTWARTGGGAPWIATTCQKEGADLWWPVKDHVSDEPDRMTIRVTVPRPLVAASNGRLETVEELADGRRAYSWQVSTPINAYNVALNIAPYETITREFHSVAGDTVPVVFYVLPEDRERGELLIAEVLDHLRFFEEVCGPYPFRADKYGVAQTPHLGMEHQTIIAYGAGFDNGAMTRGKDWGFDALHHHELSHEWWGNLVTNSDWRDMWIHEGFGSYMQPLYLERRFGVERYREYMASIRRGLRNHEPVAPRAVRSSQEVYGGDIYFKGAWILHTLRFLIGDEVFFRFVRRMAYPEPDLEGTSDGRACRFASTDELIEIAEAIAERDLAWFFEVYLRRPGLPRLIEERSGGTLTLRWEADDDLPFPMPLEVQLGDEICRIAVPRDGTVIDVPGGVTAVVDPHDWVLRARARDATARRSGRE